MWMQHGKKLHKLVDILAFSNMLSLIENTLYNERKPIAKFMHHLLFYESSSGFSNEHGHVSLTDQHLKPSLFHVILLSTESQCEASDNGSELKKKGR